MARDGTVSSHVAPPSWRLGVPSRIGLGDGQDEHAIG